MYVTENVYSSHSSFLFAFNAIDLIKILCDAQHENFHEAHPFQNIQNALFIIHEHIKKPAI